MPLAFHQCFIPLLDFVLTNDLQTREAAFADYLTVAGKLADIKIFLDELATYISKYGYFPKSTKSYFIVKKLHKRCKDHVYRNEHKYHNRREKIFTICC